MLCQHHYCFLAEPTGHGTRSSGAGNCGLVQFIQNGDEFAVSACSLATRCLQGLGKFLVADRIMAVPGFGLFSSPVSGFIGMALVTRIGSAQHYRLRRARDAEAVVVPFINT